MAGPIYATLDDYRDWLGDSAAVAPDRLRAAASADIDEALIGVVYAVAADETPTDTRVAEALRDATCAQIKHRSDAGDTTGHGGGLVFTRLTSASVGSASWSGEAAAMAPAAVPLPSGATLAADAARELRLAGLLRPTVW